MKDSEKEILWVLLGPGPGFLFSIKNIFLIVIVGSTTKCLMQEVKYSKNSSKPVTVYVFQLFVTKQEGIQQGCIELI